MGKFKPISRLGHQYGALLSEPKLDAREIAEALYQAELIEWGLARDQQGLPTHYVDTLYKRVIPAEYRDLILEALLTYCRKLGYETVVAEIAQPSKPEDHYDPNDFGV